MRSSLCRSTAHDSPARALLTLSTIFSVSALLALGGCAPPERVEPAPEPDDLPPFIGHNGDQEPTLPPPGVDVGSPADDPTAGDARPRPFAEQPDTAEGLTNVSADLESVLESGALEGACAAWESAPDDDRRQMLLCGKSMFFSEGFGTLGVPADLYDFFGTQMPGVLGAAYEGLGLVPDPYSSKGRPLGAAPGAPHGDLPTVAFTCASCHFGRLPDGRFAVGAPNHDYDYGAHILAISLGPSGVSPNFDPAEHHPQAIADVQPILDELEANTTLRWRLLFDLLPLIGGARPSFTVEEEGHYARWKPGTMDFMMTPLPLDDGVHTVSKISALWGVPSAAELEEIGLQSGLLAWSGGVDNVMDFLRGFVAVSGGADTAWPDERLRPLAEYVVSLRAPRNPAPPAAALVDEGEAIFRDADLGGGATCLDCHDGPRGMGRELYTYDEIGTDDAMRYWGDPGLTGELCCGLADGDDAPPTQGIKSPRLVGLWAMQRFLHNGSLDTLEELVCATPRPPSDPELAFGNAGHSYGCESLSAAEKVALLAYLKTR